MLAGGKHLSTTGADSGDQGVEVFFKTLFYEATGIKLPTDSRLTNYNLLALNSKNKNILDMYLNKKTSNTDTLTLPDYLKQVENSNVKDIYLEYENALKQPDSLTENSEGGIIEMYRRKGTHRKLTNNGRKIVDKATYHKIVNPILKMGADIRIADDEWLKHLEKENSSAVTIGDIIFFKPDATVSDVLEETHHFKQNKKGLNSQYGSKQREILNEIDAKEFLLSVAEKYKIPEEETILTREQLENYKKQMQELEEMGEWYD